MESVNEIMAVVSELHHPAPVPLAHHIFTDNGWTKITMFNHPTIRVFIHTEQSDYISLGYEYRRILRRTIVVVTDTGAQSCLWSRKEYLSSGFTQRDLIPVCHTMKSANRSQITIDGAIILRLTGYAEDGSEIEAAVMVYISPEARCFYLSKEAMVQLQIIPRSFPRIGGARECSSGQASINAVDIAEPVAACGCLRRMKAPRKPEKLPFLASNENIDKMKLWILKRYASSSFNCCPHQVLPDMKGPPMKIHVNPDAKFVIFTTPAPVPIHWQEKVKKDLDRDVQLGVIEKVPYGEPVKVCHRMILDRKSNGDPRRCVDLSPTNKYCEREPYPSQSPFNLARSVPPNSFKTVFDAWNGFHQLMIRLEDRYLTTFITPWGLYRYLRAVQGFISSGDGYNRRFDEIVQHMVRLLRCVDDTLIHDVDMESHWWRVIEFLEVTANSGIVLNPEKLQFSVETADFAGFRVTSHTVEPLPKYIDSIKEYPTPLNVTDIRGWFGLVNQVSHYAQLREMIEPFRKFLSPKTKFEWTKELDDVFNKSKSRIVDAIKEGVQIFDITRRTCLRTDWSKTGIGYWLLQRYCTCENRSPGCCEDGWKITLASSRFLSSAECNYAAVEGEALGVAWGLEQTRYFTLGCNDLLVVVDHKPLVKLLGDRRLDEITNPRLLRLKQRTLMWRFQIEYQPGKDNSTSDALSRYPLNHSSLSCCSLQSEPDFEEEMIVSAIATELYNHVSITRETVRSVTSDDSILQQVITYVVDGFPDRKSEMTPETQEFWEYRDKLNVWEGLLLCDDRIVVPSKLREQAIRNIHSAHQGVSGMTARANICMFWPGITTDLEKVRIGCRQCHLNAPTQPKLPPVTTPKTPKVPFEMIFSDYFQLVTYHYLIIGDRLSGWTEVIRVTPGTHSSGAKGLCSALRRVLATFGVPYEISSDGGSEYVAPETAFFFAKWGIHYHRRSSAYLPQSNGRAEVAVKSMKRALECNVDRDGSLDNDAVVRALLQLRNTPDRECGLSPAQILFGRSLRDSLPQLDKSVPIFDNLQLQDVWRKAWEAKETSIQTRAKHSEERLAEHSKTLPSLVVGDHVFIQNQNSSTKQYKKWDRQGVVVAIRDFDQHLVKASGTGRLTLRNRRFLRKVPVEYDMGDRSSARDAIDELPATRARARARAGELVSDLVPHSGPGLPNTTDDLVPRDEPESNLPNVPADAEKDCTSCPTPAVPEQHSGQDGLRRSGRDRHETQFYDAASGKSGTAHG